VIKTLLLVIAVGVSVCISGITQDRHNEKDEVKRRLLSAKDIVEKLDGKDAMASTVELIMEPGQSSKPHRHPGPVFGYILEGEYEWAIDDLPAKTLKVGETFYEPTGCLHRVSKNPSARNKARVLAVVLHPRDAKQIAIPEPRKE